MKQERGRERPVFGGLESRGLRPEAYADDSDVDNNWVPCDRILVLGATVDRRCRLRRVVLEAAKDLVYGGVGELDLFVNSVLIKNPGHADRDLNASDNRASITMFGVNGPVEFDELLEAGASIEVEVWNNGNPRFVYGGLVLVEEPETEAAPAPTGDPCRVSGCPGVQSGTDIAVCLACGELRPTCGEHGFDPIERCTSCATRIQDWWVQEEDGASRLYTSITLADTPPHIIARWWGMDNPDNPASWPRRVDESVDDPPYWAEPDAVALIREASPNAGYLALDAKAWAEFQLRWPKRVRA